jgi:hypothetical protein
VAGIISCTVGDHDTAITIPTLNNCKTNDTEVNDVQAQGQRGRPSVLAKALVSTLVKVAHVSNIKHGGK